MIDSNQGPRVLVAILSCLLWATTQVYAAPPQTGQAQEPAESLVYTVQPGDTLILVAARYGVNPAEIALANNLLNPNLIYPEQQLIFPGVALPQAAPEEPPPTEADGLHLVQPGETVSTIAEQYGISVDSLIAVNNLLNVNTLVAGRALQIPRLPLPAPGQVRPPFELIELSEPVIIQGRTLVVRIKLDQAAALSGSFEGHPLVFHSAGNGQYWSIVAIHALLEPNTYSIVLTATLPDGQQVSIAENVAVVAGPYGLENIALDNDRLALLDADLIQQERERLLDLWSSVSLQPRWQGWFRYPVAGESVRITSNFGTRRRYNDSEELSFHGGTDFGGGDGLPIYAPAAGVVVLAEPLTVRGNAVLIDHGLGLYSGYWHQSQIVVTEGQDLQPGDLIGYVGNTGLVTGPHLHWELRLNGIAVDPMQWIRQSIP